MEVNLSILAAEQTKNSSEFVASVVLTGLVVVFVALILLVFCVSVFGKIFEAKNKSNNKKAKQTDAVKTAQPKKDEAIPAPAVEDGISDEIVAVITAAVASMNDNVNGVTYCLKSIKKTSNASRRAWANAGAIDNTKPF